MKKLSIVCKNLFFREVELASGVNHPRHNSGQALLILLLVLAVALTVVLSTASRSVTDIQTADLEEDSLRAFNAAELGIEQALLQQAAPPSDTLTNNASYNVEFLTPAGDQDTEYSENLLSGDVATFWFVSHDENGDLKCGDLPCFTGNRLKFCFGDRSTIYGSAPPAIEVALYYDTSPSQAGVNSGDFSNVEVRRYAYDPLERTNGFDTASPGCVHAGALAGFAYQSPIINTNDIPCFNLQGCFLVARVRSLYNTLPSKIGMWTRPTGNNPLPAQRTEIESTGIAGGSSRKIKVMQTFSEVPNFFDAAVFSKSGITK